jgi:hypothetical protein
MGTAAMAKNNTKSRIPGLAVAQHLHADPCTNRPPDVEEERLASWPKHEDAAYSFKDEKHADQVGVPLQQGVQGFSGEKSASTTIE